MRLVCILAVSFAASTLGAQLRYVSPPGATNVELSSSSGVTFTNPTTRTQQVDSNLIGGRMGILRSMAFRRTNIHSRVGSKARTCDVTIDLGYGVTTVTNTFDSNFKTGSRATVFKQAKVSLPDWTGATTRPAPFDLVFKFTRPFVYNRKDSLVWDLIVENNTGGGTYYMDWSGSPPATTKGEKPVALGAGCKTKNGTFGHTTDHSATATTLTMRMSASNGPASAPAILIFGAKDLNASVGLCTKLHADLSFVLGFGSTNASGGLDKVLLSVPWNKAFAGLAFVSQIAAFDATQPGLPLALTNGVRSTTPFARGGQPFNIRRVFTSSGKGPTGSGPANSAAPVLWQ